MISCKVAVCLTMAFASLMCADSSAIGGPRSNHELQASSASHRHQRSRRSGENDEDDNEDNKEASEAFSNEQLAGYRFSDEFFNYPSAETAEASETEISGVEDGKKADGCERVYKDSMICMVCNDPGKNSKYEQCSYVTRPKDKIKSYASSRSYSGKPASRELSGEDDNEEEKQETSPYGRREREDEEESRETAPYSRYSREDEEETPGSPPYGRYNREDEEETEETTPYGRYSKEDDSEDREEGAYASGKPQNYVQDGGSSDESYASRESAPSSLSLYESSSGNPGARVEPSKPLKPRQGHREDYHENESSNYEDRRGQSGRSSALGTGSNEDSGSASNEEVRNSPKNNRKQSQCREVQKDSMTCTICSDPENGGNFEKCSYKHQPNDKLYKFSKSKRFGHPANQESSPEETQRVSDVVDRTKTKNPRCRKVRKDSTTLCSVCQDTTSGATSEECEYNMKAEPSNRRVSRTGATRP